MKLRIKGNSIRIRLTKSEVSQIKLGKAVEEVLSFSADSKFIYRFIPLADTRKMIAQINQGNIEVSGPLAELVEWATSDRVALKHSQ